MFLDSYLIITSFCFVIYQRHKQCGFQLPPCFKPLSQLKVSVSFPFIHILVFKSTYTRLITLLEQSVLSSHPRFFMSNFYSNIKGQVRLYYLYNLDPGRPRTSAIVLLVTVLSVNIWPCVCLSSPNAHSSSMHFSICL